MMQNKVEECRAYFDARPVFGKVFEKFCEKYESLSRNGGSIRLSGLSDEEKVQLGGFLQKDFIGIKTIMVAWKDMDEVLASSRFAPITFKDILDDFYQGQLVGKRQRKDAQLQEREQYLNAIVDCCINDTEKMWIQEQIAGKSGIYKILLQLLAEDKSKGIGTMQYVMRAGNQLPSGKGKVVNLPVFAAEITGNPHYFDEGTTAGNMLYSYLCYELKEKEQSGFSTAELKNYVFYQAGIVKDDLWNMCLVYGMHGICKDGTIHEGMEGYLTRQEPVQVTLWTLGGLEKVQSQSDNVYMVENPAIFSYLCKKYPEKSFVCGNGQLNLAVWIVLEKLEKVKCIYYSGDYDPEGLLIAQKIRKRYPELVKYWNYTTEIYENYISEEEISPTSLKKLEKVQDNMLLEVKQRMNVMKKATYQEAFLREF